MATEGISVTNRRTYLGGFVAGAAIGTLGGLIGLGGAEFRLPLLIGFFGFQGLEAVILNKATSLVVVTSALPFRAATVPWADVGAHGHIILNLLAGSLIGAWVGADWATRLRRKTLYHVIATLLLVIAGVLLFTHEAVAGSPALVGAALVVAGVLAGFIIGVVAAVLGVAGGEFLIPTLILLFGVNLRLAGSLSLMVSLPTMLVGFTRYSRDQSFSVLRSNWPFLFAMSSGSILGTFIGGRLLGTIPNGILLPILAAILVVSAIKIWRHS